MSLTAEQVAKATGKSATNVSKVWPLVVLELAQRGIGQDLVLVAAAATIATETPAFYPLRELHANALRQPDLYRQQEKYWGTGFYGRGLIQTTHRANYQAVEDATGLPVVAQPDLLLQPQPAAAALAIYFHSHNLHLAAMQQDWRKCRKLVNGGYNGWHEFTGYVDRLLMAANILRKPES
jgi:predicted chitinase